MSIDDSASASVDRSADLATSTETIDGWQIRFTGQGGEYFKIWIVNLALTILSVGIYSAWAKVRRLRYFYANTTLAGSSFDFHGSPMAILKGRIIALLVLSAYTFAPRISLLLYAVVAAIIVLGFPWLYWRSLSFRLSNTSYRGARFGFVGKLSGAYAVLLPPVFLFVGINVVIALSSRSFAPGDPRDAGRLVLKVGALYAIALAAWPYYYFRLRAYQHGNAVFGASTFRYVGTAGQFYGLAGKTILLMIGMLFMVGVIGAGLAFVLIISLGKHGQTGAPWIFVLIAIGGYAGMFALIPYVISRTQDIVWNNTQIGDARFASRVSYRKLLGIETVNLLATIFTLGLFRPFAAIRSARTKIEAIVFDGDPAIFESAAVKTGGATGAELGGMIGFDIAL